MRILDRLATTLGVPVATFFTATADPAAPNAATVEEIAELARAFAAISDPAMRRHCLDVVKAAGVTRSATA